MDSPTSRERERRKEWRCSECGQTGSWIEMRAHGNHYRPGARVRPVRLDQPLGSNHYQPGRDADLGVLCAIRTCGQSAVGTMDWPDQFTHVPLCRKHGETFTPEQLPVR